LETITDTLNTMICDIVTPISKLTILISIKYLT